MQLVISARHELNSPTYTKNVKTNTKKNQEKQKKVLSEFLNQISSYLNIL